jgi:hypothetical protein
MIQSSFDYNTYICKCQTFPVLNLLYHNIDAYGKYFFETFNHKKVWLACP